jgi:glycerol-3-phosphate dehydrogenase subunit C
MKQFLDWSSYEDAGMGDAYADIPKTGGDFAKAVAVCIGSRQCEEKGRGVMCPSFRVSDNPNLSTGGRVKLLKKALNGEFAVNGLLQPELIEAMDLCVSCKGCKRECENGVDMAAIKVEYLAQYNSQRGISWRAKLFARLPQWLHRKPWLRDLIKLRNQSRLLAYMGEKLLGITAKLPIPTPATKPFSANTDNAKSPEQIHLQTEKEDVNRQVILFVDTLSYHFEPKIAEAAVAVLENAGYRVSIARPEISGSENDRPLCCGRSYLSQGMVEEAKQEAHRTVAALLPHIQAGRPIIGLEPSCLLMLRDEYMMLDLGEDAKALANQTMLLEEFLAKEISAKRLNLNLREESKEAPALIHGHCHQKAVGAMKAMRKVLKQIPDLDFDNIEAGCCGMAGSFGLEAEHFPLARQMAEQDLLPALRAAPQATVIANGFSCRQQIRTGSDHQPVHLAIYLQKKLNLTKEKQRVRK